MEVEAVTIATLSLVDNSSKNAVTEHMCSIIETIRSFLPKKGV